MVMKEDGTSRVESQPTDQENSQRMTPESPGDK